MYMYTHAHIYIYTSMYYICTDMHIPGSSLLPIYFALIGERKDPGSCRRIDIYMYTKSHIYIYMYPLHTCRYI